MQGCTLTIAGSEEEVLKVAVRHAVDEHGHTLSEDLKNQIRGILKDET